MKQILTFMLLFTAISLAGVAYAVEVPVDEGRFDTSVLNCKEMSDSGNLWCVWNPINNSGYTGNQTDSNPEEVSDEPAVPVKLCPDRFYADGDFCLPIVGDGIDITTPPQDEIEFFENMAVMLENECADGCKSSDMKLMEILQDPLTFCIDGDKTSVNIQSPGSTIDPTGLIPHETDNDSNRWLDVLKANREKCKADVVLDEDIHNESHRNKSKLHWWDKENTIPDWRYNITLNQGIQYPELDDTAFEENAKKVLHDVCYGTQWKNVDKITFGCPEDSLYKPTEHKWNYLGIESQHKVLVPIEQNKVWQDSQRFYSGDLSQQLQKAIKVNAERNAASAGNYGGQQ